MNKKLINNPNITNWLNLYGYGANLYGADIDGYIAECISEQLYQFSPDAYARDPYRTTSFIVGLPYIDIRDVFGDNFIGLIADDGKDYSYIVKDLTEFDKKYRGSEDHYRYHEKVCLDRYYEFENCPFVIKLDAITIFHAQGSPYTLMPQVDLSCAIVSKEMLERKIK